MAKGDDAIRKKKNKVLRKRMRNDSSSAKVSSRIAGIIASKQRRKAGKRRMCEGMCFSLPTPDDPFNDRQTEKDANKKAQKLEPSQTDAGTALAKEAASTRINLCSASSPPFSQPPPLLLFETFFASLRSLKGCDPEFLIATPERLLELVSLKAIDLSGLYFLVVDGLETFAKQGLLNTLTSIRQSISRDTIHEVPKTLIFCNNLGALSTSVVKKLVYGPICRLSCSDSIASQTACITQCLHVCALEERALKAIEILDEQVGQRLGFGHSKVLFVEGSCTKAQSLAVSLTAKGYSPLKDAFSDCSEADSRIREKPDMVTVTDLEHVGRLTNLDNFDLVIILQFPSSVDDYVKILTKIARDSLDAELHSFFGQEDMPLAGPLLDVLKQCGQTMPESPK